MTSPRELSNGPPEFPGFSAASVWMTSGIRRPVLARMLRPSALTMPAVTVCSNPSGLPMAIAIWPGASPLSVRARHASARPTCELVIRRQLEVGSQVCTWQATDVGRLA